ncbi:hypothetical protein OHS33_17640 [Streptomyces sp. NBC_00536]|uniref:hypothetical protein n=1 Tax=Streptomyces sp. NBC_00536 TaxID=2975769 RepID=UPI002E80BDD3|nr:hypothetical protein [Streptomyces sp. NBC_00536]WUC80006.1 hypothetical protein OHS33_17640 [Streptomyces sp. NBC_00536]
MRTATRRWRAGHGPGPLGLLPRDWSWQGWTGAAPFWVNVLLLVVVQFSDVTLLAQVGIITALAALGGLVRHFWYGDYGHPAVHLAAALLGAAAVAFVLT